MTIGTGRSADQEISRPVAWVVPGPLRQVTGGYLYDARIVDGLRARGWRIGVVDIRSSRWPLDPASGRRLVSALSRERWGAVVVDELAHPALAAAPLTGRLRLTLHDAPLVLLVHHLRCSEPSSRLSRAAASIVETLALRSANLVICTSETTARTVRPLTPRTIPIRVVRPGWDTHEDTGAMNCAPTASDPVGAQFIAPASTPPASTPPASTVSAVTPPASTSPASSTSRASSAPTSVISAVDGNLDTRNDGHFHLLLVGHWTPRKGILDALAAVARLGPRVSLDLVGEQDRDPHYAARVQAVLRDPALHGRVRVHGRVSSDALSALFKAADALVLPSTHEGYGMVLAEALAAGLPIVATRVGAVSEVVRDGHEAVLVPAGDIAALARAIDQLAADPKERRHRSGLARERAQSLPRWSDSIDAFEGHLRALVARTLSGA